MAVALNFSYVQANDNKTIQITDATGEYDVATNTGGWGTPNEDTSDVVALTTTTALKLHLSLDIVYTDSSGVETTYDTIDLYDNFTSEFSKSYGMIYTLTMAHMKVSTVSQGLATDEFGDGIYDVTYTIAPADTDVATSTKNLILFVYGVIQDAVYANMTASNTEIYKQLAFNADEKNYRTQADAVNIYSYYRGMLTNNEDSSQADKIEMLYFLEQRLNS